MWESKEGLVAERGNVQVAEFDIFSQLFDSTLR